MKASLVAVFVLVAVVAVSATEVARPNAYGAPGAPEANEPTNTNLLQVSVGEEGEFTPCKTCVFVLERIKKGTNMLLPAICSEVYMKYPDSYGTCHHVLNALSLNGNNVRYWLFEGCYKYEIYGAREWIKPCPTHVMCSTLQDLANQPFCAPLPMENPFGGGEE